MKTKAEQAENPPKSKKKNEYTTSRETSKEVPVERKLFVRNFKKARDAAGFSQDDVHDLTGFSKSYISDLERCKVNISLDNMAKLSHLVGIALADLLKP